VTWAPDYATTAEVKSYLGITDTADDVLIALWVTAASRAVDKFCGRQFGKVSTVEVREYTPAWDRTLGKYVAQIDDIQDVSALTVIDSLATVITDYELGPINAAKKGKPYERIVTSARGVLTLDGLWGWTAVPSSVKAATLLQAARLSARRTSPFGIAGSPDQGSELRLLAALDPDLMTSLSAFRRDWWAA
jgi:hypothetical protein